MMNGLMFTVVDERNESTPADQFEDFEVVED
jgi:hypothetical protein